jgi:cytochrome P450
MQLPFETNLVAPDLIVNQDGPPHDLFARWRRDDPIHWNPPPAPGSYPGTPDGGRMDKGFWVLTRHADVAKVSMDQDLYSSHVGTPVIWEMPPELLAIQQTGLMAMPMERHAKVKRLIMPPFAGGAMDAFTPEIARVADEIVKDVAARGECEFIFDVASRLPVYTFCVLMGIADADREQVFQLGNALADVESRTAADMGAMMQLFGIAARLTEEKRGCPDGSMMSAYVNTDVSGEKLSPEEIAMFFLTMAIAGHETTRGTAGHFIRLMAEHPDQYALLRSDPDRYLPNAIDEVLRMAPPVMQFRRTATRDTELGGKTIRAGDKLYLAYAAANRDPAVFENPDQFDITRSNAKRHLSFGTGPHVCIGARLAHLQLKLLLERIITRIPDIQPTVKPRYLRSIWFNAIIEMPVSFTSE